MTRKKEDDDRASRNIPTDIQLRRSLRPRQPLPYMQDAKPAHSPGSRPCTDTAEWTGTANTAGGAEGRSGKQGIMDDGARSLARLLPCLFIDISVHLSTYPFIYLLSTFHPFYLSSSFPLYFSVPLFLTSFPSFLPRGLEVTRRVAQQNQKNKPQPLKETEMNA